MTPVGPGSTDRLRRTYARLLRLYPRAFRERYENDLLQAFDDRRAEPRFAGRLGGLRLLLFLVRDSLTAVPSAHLTTTTDRAEDTMADFLRDVGFSVRMLVKNPTFTAAAVLTLALGIGMNAATFSAVQGLLLRPLSGVEDPDELVQIFRRWPGIEHGSNSIPHYQDLRDRSGDAFESVAAYTFSPVAVSAEGRSERIIGMLVSANFFQTYGVRPLLGRVFVPGVEDRDPGAHPVAVLGHGYWQSRFGADPSVVGRTVVLNGHPFEVVGVAPPDFAGPVTFAAVPMYMPMMMQPVIEPGTNRMEARGNNYLRVVARMRDGMDIERAHHVLGAVLAGLREEHPDAYDDQLGTTLVLQSDAGIDPSLGGAQTGMSVAMMAVVALLLLIACVNVANLFLARARDRRREMGVRLSLGAGRGRIVRQLLTESLVFSALSGIAGLGLAHGAVTLLDRVRPPMDGPWDFRIEMDGTVLLFTLVLSVAAGFLFGLAPALHAARPDPVSAVRGERDGRPGRSRASAVLVVAQMALSLLLLIGSALFLRSLHAATRIDPGFEDPSTLAMVSLDPALQGYDRAEAQLFWDRLLEDVRALPDVRSAGLTGRLPLGLDSSQRGVTIPGYDFAEGEQRSLDYGIVGDGYLETLGIELLEGRTFSRADDADAAPVLIVNRRFAERFWPGTTALGKVVETAGKARQVIGIVETGKYRSLGEDAKTFMYLPQRDVPTTALTLVVRTGGEPGAVLPRVQEVVRGIDPDLPVYDLRTMENHMGLALLPARLGGSVLGLFGALGLTLAAVGIYGVMAYSVSQRRREIGVRVALGADRRGVLRLVLGQGLRLALVGTALGIAGAAVGARLLAGLLYGVPPTDPVAFTTAPLVLFGVAMLAVYLPARRAAAADPMSALKTD